MGNHEHKFKHVTSVSCEDGKLVTRKRCTRKRQQGSSFSPRTGNVRFNETPCDAEKVEAYSLWSIVDIHDHHDGKSSIDVDEVESLPDWAEHAKDRGEGQIDHRSPELFMTSLRGPEINMMVATSETEYNLIYNDAETRIEE